MDAAQSADAHNEPNRPDAPAPGRTSTPASDTSPLPFPIVGIGAAEGGLEACAALCHHLPAEPEMSFVLIPHADAHALHELTARLQSVADMPVIEAADGIALEPNAIYVSPPGRNINLEAGMLRLTNLEDDRRKQATIDHFLRALSRDQGANAVGVVLSGTGSAGVLGLQSIKKRGGLIMAQSPDEAEYEGMPRRAVETGMLDFVGTTHELADKLIALRRAAAQLPVPERVEQLSPDGHDTLDKILQHLHLRTGHDFSTYKRSTVLRRLRRRLQLVQEVTSLSDYLGFLRQDSEEVWTLVRELLICVTNFFRDLDTFEALRKRIIPQLFEDKGPQDTVRIWVCGCATGEEAYTIAMICQHYADSLASPPTIQVFATDLSKKAITTARASYYPEAIREDVPEEYLARFFARDGASYRVKREIRELIVFANHNLLNDPPFSRLDLISCRNVLIYLQRETQMQVFESFHYGLRSNGFLFLGSAESANAAEGLFEPMIERHRIYRRTARFARHRYVPTLPSARSSATFARIGEPSPHPEELTDFQTIAESLLSDYAPPGVVVNENYNLVYVLEKGARYLRFRPGAPSLNVLEVIHSALKASLRTALFQAFQEEEITETDLLSIEASEASWQVRLEVRPIQVSELRHRHALVLFQEEGLPEDAPATAPAARTLTPDRGEPDDQVRELQQALRRTRARLRSTIEEYEASMEELSASNEELQSMNEELHSTAEELETSKEELQSMNEELITVNEELIVKNEELNRAKNDLENLVVSTEIATLFLDRQLCIQRFTPQATALFNLLESDRGRPLSHVTKKFEREDFLPEVETVLETLISKEYEVETEEGRWFMARIRPYRTIEQDKIDGLVLTFIDITDRVETEQALRSSRERFRWLSESGVIGMATFDADGWITDANATVLEMTGYSRETLEKQDVHWRQLVPAAEEERILKAVQEAQETGNITPREMHFLCKNGELICTLFGASLSDDRSEGVAFLLDITERKRLEEELRANEERLRLAQRGARAGAWDWYVQEERTVWSEEYRAVYGIGPDRKASYENWLATVHPDDREEADAYVQAFLEERREELRFEFRINHPEKGTRWLASLGRAQFDENGRTERVLGIAIDITERKEAQQQLERLNELLEQRVQERTATLKRKNREVRRLAAALTLAEQRERQRISQMLHDHVQQLLYGLEMSQRQLRRQLDELPDAQRTSQAQILDQMEEILNEAIDYTRTLTVELSPPVLQGDEFEATLRWLARHMRERHGLSVQLTMHDACEGFSEELRILLFQLVRELLFNIVKHAGVDRAHLEARQHEDYVAVEVSDAGKGFDPAILQGKPGIEHGIGLAAMRERLQTLGGHLDIRSQPDEGTKVTIQVPTHFQN